MSVQYHALLDIGVTESLQIPTAAFVGDGTFIPWDRAIANVGDMFDVASPTKITIKEGGLYLVIAQLMWGTGASDGTVRRMQILMDSHRLGDPTIEVASCYALPVKNLTPYRTVINASRVVRVHRGDFFRVKAEQDTGGSVALWAHNEEVGYNLGDTATFFQALRLL